MYLINKYDYYFGKLLNRIFLTFIKNLILYMLFLRFIL